MYRRFWLVGTAAVFGCGFVLYLAYLTSGAAAWSLLVSSVNRSPWELVKPFALVYLLWSFVELSVLRPSLLHYVCSRILSLQLFVWVTSVLLCVIPSSIQQEWLQLSVIGSMLLLSQAACAGMYRSSRRWELLALPIFISFFLLFGCLLFCTVYPPHFPLFCDHVRSSYGI